MDSRYASTLAQSVTFADRYGGVRTSAELGICGTGTPRRSASIPSIRCTAWLGNATHTASQYIWTIITFTHIHQGRKVTTMRMLFSFIQFTTTSTIERQINYFFQSHRPNLGVIVTGQLPLWLFTALARFYAERNVPWIALNDAHDNKPVVIYSQVTSHPIGTILPAM